MLRNWNRGLGCAGLTLGLLFAVATDAQAGVDEREERQRDRIEAGLEDGSLTPGEARRAVRDQRRIERKEQRFRANDGKLGPRERVRLNRELDRSAAKLYRRRHNDRTQQAD